MVDYFWPSLDDTKHLGKPSARLDGPIKSTGRAEYASDKELPGLLHGRLLTCPHAHAVITKLDVTAAAALPGVRTVHIIQPEGSRIQWAHDEIVAVAATSEDIARDAMRAIEVEYEVLAHYVDEENLEGAPRTRPGETDEEGSLEQAFAEADVVLQRELGMPQIAHLCLEPHGQTVEWAPDLSSCTVHASTQAVSTMPSQMSDGLKLQGVDIKAPKIRVLTDFMGGGFGAKFGPDRWGIVCALLAREGQAPVKLFLERDQEVAVSGSRPSAFSKVRIGATRDGQVTAWESESWGSGGLPGTTATPLPYVFNVPNRRRRHVSVPTNKMGSKAWRAPNHPQACFVTMACMEDMAAALEMDPVTFFKKNLPSVARFADVYAQQLDIASERMGWARRWRPRSESGSSPEESKEVRRGLGVSLHTWGGRGHRSTCDVVLHPDGSVEARIGTQDLGTGTRSVVAAVVAETFGLELDQVDISIGDSRFPQSGPSGGSSTVGGVSGSSRRAAQAVVQELFEKVAPEVGVASDQLRLRGGQLVSADGTPLLSLADAAALAGPAGISASGRNPGPGKLNDSGVAGVQMADVSVDIETGVVTMNRMVAVQDCGLVVNTKLAESQVHGGLIMGIGYALYEELLADPLSGQILNADMEFYRLASLMDVGELDVHLMTGPGHDERGVIGLGEPPVISPGAAISNAVANAIGHRVPYLPITPQRVIDTLEAAGREGRQG